MFFDKKAREVETLILAHCTAVKKALLELQLMISEYSHHDKAFKKESYKVHLLEHEADEIRREIGLKLFQGAFLPIYREDYFKLVEMVDKVANRCEAIGDYVTLTRPIVPEAFNNNVQELMVKTVEVYGELEKMLACFLEGSSDLPTCAAHIRDIEQKIDTDQFHLERALFKSDLEKIEKLITKDFIDGISKLSNQVEDVADQMEVIAAKNRF